MARLRRGTDQVAIPVELITSAKNSEDRNAPVITDIAALEKAIEETLAMLERVSAYVERVLVCSGH